MSEIARLIIPKKTLEADRRIGQSEAFLARQVHPTVQLVASKKKNKVPFLSNQIRLAGREVGRIVIRTSYFVSANQKPSEHPSDDLQDNIFVSANQKPSEHPSDNLLWTDFRIGQSHPSDGSSFGRTFLSAKHILRTDHPLDRLSYRSITSFRRIILRTDISYRPITSFG